MKSNLYGKLYFEPKQEHHQAEAVKHTDECKIRCNHRMNKRMKMRDDAQEGPEQ